MNAERFERMNRIFDGAVELNGPAQRAFLDEQCGEDADLRAEIAALLQEDRQDRATPVSGVRHIVERMVKSLPERIGPYTIIKKIGEGGMGEVYLAEQVEPLRRQVAVKVMRQGLESDRIVARFEAERQALARMQHSNIAGVLDAGCTDDGRPYFIMEYVKGVPITMFCDRHQLTTQERLELFKDVCSGIQHAHQKSIIHRDIKPSNVLVTMQDGRAVPKIIDFGVAKATEKLTEHTLMTEHGQLIGTPEYMSPEQAMLDGDAIDTRTDIYSLGVLLYELLVGVLPFESEDLRRGAVDEILRRIREEDPPRPSLRMRTEAGHSRTTATHRKTSAGRLTSQLRGDLDWITMKALEKDRDRRYGSPSEFSADIDRFLRNEPVVAGPPSAVYRLSKFTRRHRIGVAVAAASLTMLVVFAAAMTVQADRIAQERDRANAEAVRANDEADTARQIADFLVDLFKQSDPGRARGETLTARDILATGAERIESLNDQPKVQATLMETIGWVYLVLGHYDSAGPLLIEAVKIREAHPNDLRELATSLHMLSNYEDNRGQPESGEPIARRAVAIWEQVDPESDSLADSINTLANCLWHLDRLDEAEESFNRSLAIREAIDPNHPDLTQSLHNLGAMRYFASDLAGAESHWKRCMDIHRADQPEDNYHLATSMHTLAIVYQDQHRYDEALELELKSLAMREKVLGPEHPHVALSLTTLGNIYRGMERHAEAEPCIRRAVEIATSKWGPTHGEVWWMRRSLARTLIALDRLADAEGELDDLIGVVREAGKESSLPLNLNALGSVYLKQDRLEDAERIYQQSLEICERTLEAGDPSVGLACEGLGNTLRDMGRFDEAESNYVRALKIMDEAWGPDDPDRKRAAASYAAMQEARDQSGNEPG